MVVAFALTAVFSTLTESILTRMKERKGLFVCVGGGE